MLTWEQFKLWLIGVPKPIALPQPEASRVVKYDVMAPMPKKIDRWLRRNLPRSYAWARDEFLATAKHADRCERKARGIADMAEAGMMPGAVVDLAKRRKRKKGAQS